MLEKEFRVLKILDKELLLLSLDDKKELLCHGNIYLVQSRLVKL